MAPTMGSMGSHIVGHDWRDLAAAAAADLGHAGIKKKIPSRISFFFPIQELQRASQISKPSAYFYYQYYSKEKEDKAELFLSVQKVIKLYRYFLKSSVIVMLTDENTFMHHFSKKKNYGIPRSPNSYPPYSAEHTWCHDSSHEASTVMTLIPQMRRLCIGIRPTPGQHGQQAAVLGRGMQQAFWSGPVIPTTPKLLRL